MLKPGDNAPAFDLPCALNGTLGRLKLGDFRSEFIVLFFYPRDFSFICPTEVVGFHHKRTDFAAEQSELAAASVDDAQTHLRWTTELGGISYALLADEGGKLAKSYGVLDESKGVALRATFILDRSRTIAYASASRANVGRSVGETLRVLRALRTGRLCPADWNLGQTFGPPEGEY